MTAPHHVFLHVPKTAGSSLRTVLSRQYGARHVLYVDLGAGDRRPMPEIGAQLRQVMATRPPVTLLTGHQFLGLHEALREPCLYFTMLRDPVERVLSEYFYAFSYPHHQQRAEILSGALTPMGFLTGRHGRGEAQAQQIAGRATRPLRDAALANLRDAIAVVGVAEDFDRSLLLMARRLGWGPPLYVARNVTRLDPAQEAARRQARAAAAAHRALFATDLALHEAARARLAADCAAEGPDFEAALAAFGRCQAALAEGAGDLVYERYEFRADDALPPWAAAVQASADHALLAAFLAAPPVAHPRPRNLLGRLDRVQDGTLHGWATDLLAAGPVTLRLVAEGAPLPAPWAATRAQLHRPDLAAAGIAGGFCAFRLKLPEGAAGRPGLRLVAEGTDLAIPDPDRLLG
ncbi:sulfotransferase family 2 domain-containing protein [Falsiroseomonas selenitidurans]|uniref:Sulfotransferase family protein n=1 Tax=Falsiroseomonas selenitidurans TaxID=2716335 RepID=A0ABX1E4J9_9PROT|nr:sulfotransferase family 2 domain-containing protein [Falsiroseomonas selenitidurans]NKC31708.1 sulfotransferase family protein [Falsiroseomonas selenitidurans]